MVNAGHDWATSRWLKYFSLLVYFNSVPAAVAAFVTGLSMGVLTSLRILPHFAWMPLCEHVVPVLVFFFWQEFLQLIGKTRMVFLDCACIPQHDEALKAQCVRGLASFLGRSNKLVVLWSPRYFRRSWARFACYL